MSLECLEYTAVLKHPCSQHSQESPATSFYFHLALMLESIPLKRFSLYLLLGPCLSLCTFLLCLSLYHTQPKLSGSLLKPFAAPLCLDPYLRAGIQYLMPPLNMSSQQLSAFPSSLGKTFPCFPQSHSLVLFQIPLLKQISLLKLCFAQNSNVNLLLLREFCHVMCV